MVALSPLNTNVRGNCWFTSVSNPRKASLVESTLEEFMALVSKKSHQVKSPTKDGYLVPKPPKKDSSVT